jgi:hypothetical protein
MTLKSEIQNLLKRFKLQSTTSDVVAVESLIDRISPPVPISASFLLYSINSAQSNTATSGPIIYQPNNSNPAVYPVVPENYGGVLKPGDYSVPAMPNNGGNQAAIYAVTDTVGNTQSLVARLDYSTTLINKYVGTSQTFFVLITINRGTYWGDCNLSMIAPPQFSLIEDNPIPQSISQNETQTAIAFTFTPDAAGKYTAVFQLDCDGVIISRTLEVIVESKSDYGDDGYGYGFSGLGGDLLK